MTRVDWSWIPNALTVLRFIAAVLLPWVPAPWQFTVLLVAGLSDLVDGLLSRWLRATSSFGQVADPIADKTLVIVAVLCALRAEWLSGWELLALVARDVTVPILSVLAMARNRENWKKLTPRWSGKVATGAQLVALLSLYWYQHPLPLLVAIAGAASICSALDYTWKAFTTPSDP